MEVITIVSVMGWIADLFVGTKPGVRYQQIVAAQSGLICKVAIYYVDVVVIGNVVSVGAGVIPYIKGRA